MAIESNRQTGVGKVVAFGTRHKPGLAATVAVPPVSDLPPVVVPDETTHLLIYIGQTGKVEIQPCRSQGEMTAVAARLRYGHGIATQVIKVAEWIR